MNMSNLIAHRILQMLDGTGQAEIRRNEFAQDVGCVPSQINYVIASRFTPEHGFIVESRRGGGGYIRIRRVALDRDMSRMHVVNSIGERLDEQTCRAHVLNLLYSRFLDERTAKLLLAGTADTALRDVPPDLRECVRARIFKQLLLAAE